MGLRSPWRIEGLGEMNTGRCGYEYLGPSAQLAEGARALLRDHTATPSTTAWSEQLRDPCQTSGQCDRRQG